VAFFNSIARKYAKYIYDKCRPIFKVFLLYYYYYYYYYYFHYNLFYSFIARSSSTYNNILALGATGVENETNKGGWEKIHGDHSVTLHGRTYHFLPPAQTLNPTGGISYFTFDTPAAYTALDKHADRVNRRKTGMLFLYHKYGMMLCY
jgi:hypothetical protein